MFDDCKIGFWWMNGSIRFGSIKEPRPPRLLIKILHFPNRLISSLFLKDMVRDLSPVFLYMICVEISRGFLGKGKKSIDLKSVVQQRFEYTHIIE
jgi:hypothetical protein